MKKRNWRMTGCLIACIGLLVTTACGGDDDEEESRLTVDLSEMTFTHEGESKTLRIESNTDWTITGYPGWLSVSPSSSSDTKTVVVSASENTTISARNCQMIVTTADGKHSHTVSVKQEGMQATLSVDVTQLTLAGTAHSTGTFRITSNGDWTISGAGDWITLSSSGGSGNASIIVTAKSDNNTSSDRECSLQVTNGDASATVTVTQSALLTAGCSVKPNKIVAMADGVATDFTSESNVAYFYTGVWTYSASAFWTDEEILQQLTEDITERLVPNNDVISWSNLNADSDYMMFTVGFDKNGNRGELYRTKIHTRSSQNMPLVYIENVQYSDDYFRWTTTKGPYADKYYMINLTDPADMYLSDMYIAWYFKYLLDTYPGEYSLISNDTYVSNPWYIERNGRNFLHVVTWGVDTKGELGGMINRYRGTIESSEVRVANAPKVSKREVVKNGAKRRLPLSPVKKNLD